MPEILGLESIHFAQGLSVVAQAVTLWLVYRLGCASLSPGRALVAPALLAGQVAFLAYPMTGMETGFYTMLVTLAFYLLRREAWRTRWGCGALGAALVALILIRFDGFVPVLLLVSYETLRLRTARPLLPALVVLALGLIAFNLWRISYYPTWLPNTFHAKTSFSVSRMQQGLEYVVQFVAESRQGIVLLAAVALLSRGSSAAWAAGWMAAGLVGYAVAVGGDWMPLHRFLLPALPFLTLLAQDGLWRAWGGLRPAGARGAAATAILLGLVGVMNVVPVYLHRELDGMTAAHFQLYDARRIGRYLDESVPPEHVVAIEWGGIIPYYARQPFLDTFGLTDREIVQLPLARTRWGRQLTPEYLAGRAPDVVVTCARIFPTREAALRATDPNGVADYGYYMNLVREGLGYEVKVFRIEDDEFWPGLVRTAR